MIELDVQHRHVAIVGAAFEEQVREAGGQVEGVHRILQQMHDAPQVVGVIGIDGVVKNFVFGAEGIARLGEVKAHAVMVGAMFGGEVVHSLDVVAMVVILAGVGLIALARERRAA